MTPRSCGEAGSLGLGPLARASPHHTLILFPVPHSMVTLQGASSSPRSISYSCRLWCFRGLETRCP